MKIECQKSNRTLIVRLYGEIDHHFTEDIRERVDKEFNIKKCQNILIDFNNVNFMDSSGIGMIIGRYKLVSQMGGKVYAFGLKNNAKRVFDMSGLNKLIKCFELEQEAINSI